MFQPQMRWTPRMQRQLIAIERTQGFLEALQFRPEWLSRLRHDVRISDALASI